MAKAINTLGDNRLSLSVNASRWALNPGHVEFVSSAHTVLQENDFDYSLLSFRPATGAPIVMKKSLATVAIAGDMGSQCFAIATDLETSNGLEISGLNAEEQSDISLLLRYSAAQGTLAGVPSFTFNPTVASTISGTSVGFIYEVFTYVDSMIVLKENNVLELIQ